MRLAVTPMKAVVCKHWQERIDADALDRVKRKEEPSLTERITLLAHKWLQQEEIIVREPVENLTYQEYDVPIQAIHKILDEHINDFIKSEGSPPRVLLMGYDTYRTAVSAVCCLPLSEGFYKGIHVILTPTMSGFMMLGDREVTYIKEKVN